MAFIINNSGLTGAASKYTAQKAAYDATLQKLKGQLANMNWADAGGEAMKEVVTKAFAEFDKISANLEANSGLLNDVSGVASETQAKITSEVNKMY